MKNDPSTDPLKTFDEMLSTPCCIFSLNESDKFVEINADQENLVNSLIGKIRENPELFLYRGVNRKFLESHLIKKGESFSDEQVCGRLFYFGEKAKSALKNREDERWLKNYQDLSRETTDKIFDKLCKNK